MRWVWSFPVVVVIAATCIFSIRACVDAPPRRCVDEVQYMPINVYSYAQAKCSSPEATLSKEPLDGAGYLFKCTCPRGSK